MTVHHARSIGAHHPRVRDLLALRKDGLPGRIMVEATWEHERLLTPTAANADCLVLTSRRARPTHPAVYSASRGTVLSTPIVEFDDIPAAAAWLRGHRFRVHLADPAATGTYRVPQYDGPTAFVVGSE